MLPDRRILGSDCEIVPCFVNETGAFITEYVVVDFTTFGSTMGAGPTPCEPRASSVSDDPPSAVRTLPVTGVAPELLIAGALALVCGGLLVMTGRRRS